MTVDLLESPAVAAPRPPRLLVITYHFPPDGSIGGLRWSGLAKNLARLGWDVHVLTAAPQPRGAEHEFPVHVCPRGTTLNDAYNRVARRIRGARGHAPTDEQGATTLTAPRAGWLAATRRELAASLAFPDGGRGWILRAALRARRLIDRHGFDVVVSSGPPHSAHLVGLLATAGRPVRFVVDFRDPWAGLMSHDWGSSFFRSWLNRTQIPALERRIVAAADQVIVNTAEFAASFARSYPAAPVCCVPNGVDLERLPPPARDPFPGLALAYVGSMYAGRDLSPVLRALRLFLDRHPGARHDGTRLRIAGNMDGRCAAAFARDVAALELGEMVEPLGVVPGAEALRLLARSRLSIVLAQNQALQVPAKVYESVGMRLATLVITEPGSATAREAERLGAETRDPADVEGTCRLLEQLWTGRFGGPALPDRPIDYAGLAREMASLLAPAGAATV